jgi:CRP/FNR family transcriptional regulator, cyclic AMP receptor protein
LEELLDARRDSGTAGVAFAGLALMDLDLLHSISIFGGLRPETLSFLLERTQPVRVAKGDVFFHEGDPGGALYILRSGRADVLKGHVTESGKTEWIRIAELKAGDCFGEASLLAVMPRSATVAAAEDCDALRLRYTDLYALYTSNVEQFAMLIMNLGREVTRRLWKTDQLLLDFAEPRRSLAADAPGPRQPRLAETKS